MRRVGAALVAAVVLIACQPADRLVGDEPTPASTSASPRRGAPLQAFPGDLAAVRRLSGQTARTWQHDPRLVEVVVELDEDGSWRRVRTTYLAADADRLLVIDATPEGVTQQRPTLDTLGLQAVPADALDEVPPLPDGALEPAALVQVGADTLAACDVSRVDVAIYTTGAPVTWDGRTWTQAPAWLVVLAQADEEGRPTHFATLTVEGAPAGPDPCGANDRQR